MKCEKLEVVEVASPSREAKVPNAAKSDLR